MHLNSTHLKELEAFAIEAATVAGKLISETRPQNVQRKAGGDCLASQVLTEVDGQSQELILQTLKPTFPEFDLALLTEECPDDGSRLIKDYFWCIDPIDGTLPFIEGTSGYAVSIALVSKAGIPHIGVVYDPVEHNLYHAILGEGAFKNSKPWKLRKGVKTLHMATDRSFAERTEYPDILKALERFGYDGVEATTHGGGVMNAIWVLEHSPACYFKFPRPEKSGGCFWDFAATACLFHELGCVATDFNGEPLELNRPDSLYMNHKGTLFATHGELAEKIMALKNLL